jgi:hypothetical protein
MKSSVTQRAIAQAIAFLRTSKCTFVIYDEEGNEIANTVPRRKSGVQYKPHFKPFIDALNGEGITDIVVPEEFDPVPYRAALAGYLHHEFGAGGYITSLDKETRTISVMVVSTGDSVHEVEGTDEVKQQAVAKGGVNIDTVHHRTSAPLNPVLTNEIVEAIGVPDFSKVD